VNEDMAKMYYFGETRCFCSFTHQKPGMCAVMLCVNWQELITCIVFTIYKAVSPVIVVEAVMSLKCLSFLTFSAVKFIMHNYVYLMFWGDTSSELEQNSSYAPNADIIIHLLMISTQFYSVN